MQTQVEFTSEAFPMEPNEEALVNPQTFGKLLTDFLAKRLPACGYVITGVTPEDWGWMIELRNQAFPLWIGCGNRNGQEDAFICFVEPYQPSIRRWFKKIDTTQTVEKLTATIDDILRGSGKVSAMRWKTFGER